MQDDGTLARKVVHGGIWLFSMRLFTRGFGFIRTIILARLLTPADFGLVGIALLVISTVDSLSQTGFEATIVREKNLSPSLLNTAWTLLILRGLILFLILFTAAPWVAQFFNMPSIDLILKVIAISVVVAGFRNIGTVFFQKDLRFDQGFKFETAATLVDLLISITLAFIMRDAWALVWGGLAGNLMRLLLSYLLNDYRPRIAIGFNNIKELLGFGKWILGSGIIYSILVQIDSFTIGKLLGATDVGLYQMAMTLAFLPSTEISYLMSHISFPAYSIIQDDIRRLQSAYLDVLHLTCFICIPIGAALFVMAHEFIALFLGNKWLPVVPCMQLLIFSGTFAAIGRTAFPVFLAKGKPKYETYLQSVNLILLVVTVYPLTLSYGITGTAFALIFGQSIIFFGGLYAVSKLTGCKPSILAKVIMAPLVNSFIMSVIIIFVRNWTQSLVLPAQFVLSLLSGSISYLVLTYYVDLLTGNRVIPHLIQKYRLAKQSSSRE